MYFIYLCMALIAGIGLAVQAAINAQLGRALFHQPIYAAFISFLVGTILLLIIVLAKGNFTQTLLQLPQQPWWRFTGGLIGAFVVFSTILLAPKLGMANMLLFIIFGQLLMGVVIDQFGLIGMPVNPVSWFKIIGLIVIGFGLFIFFFAEKLFHQG